MKQQKTPEKPAAAPIWSVPVKVADIPEAGRRMELAADEATRRAIAEASGLIDLPRLDVVFDLARQGRSGARVSGHLSATAIQACVVTLDPVETAVEEPIALVLLPPERGPAGKLPSAADQERAMTVDIGSPDEPDPPEVLRGDSVDLGAIAVEFLLLGLDPYPRKPGVVFDAPTAETPEPGPFAALAALKKDSLS